MITREQLLKFVVIDLGLPPSAIHDFDELTLSELMMLAEYKREKDKQQWEMAKRAVMFGIASAFKGKEIPMFESDKPKVKKVSREQREADLQYLREQFGDVF